MDSDLDEKFTPLQNTVGSQLSEHVVMTKGFSD